MKPRAAIFDIYRTLLEVGPAPADAGSEWGRLWNRVFAEPPPLGLPAVATAAEEVIRRHHALAREQGIPHPEVDWASVLTEVLPPLAGLNPPARDDLLFAHAQLTRTVRLAPDVALVLRNLRDGGTVLGIASNAQAYTLRELATALAPSGLGLGLFDPSLRFWSFEHGFSKPDPHVFRILDSRLRARGIAPSETLMIGDRSDNDIVPARRVGWRTWHLDSRPDRSWAALHAALRSRDDSPLPTPDSHHP